MMVRVNNPTHHLSRLLLGEGQYKWIWEMNGCRTDGLSARYHALSLSSCLANRHFCYRLPRECWWWLLPPELQATVHHCSPPFALCTQIIAETVGKRITLLNRIYVIASPTLRNYICILLITEKMGTSQLKIMTLLNSTTRLDPKLVQSTLFVTTYFESPNDSEIRYITHTHTHTQMPIHYYHAGSIKRAECKSFQRQIYTFPVLRTQNKKTPFHRAAVAQWLRWCATNRKVAGVSGFFNDIKSFRWHYGPGVDSASNRNEYQVYFLGGKGGRCVRLTTYHHPVPLSRNLGTLTSWNPLGLSRPVMGLLYLLPFHRISAMHTLSTAPLKTVQRGNNRS